MSNDSKTPTGPESDKAILSAMNEHERAHFYNKGTGRPYVSIDNSASLVPTRPGWHYRDAPTPDRSMVYVTAITTDGVIFYEERGDTKYDESNDGLWRGPVPMPGEWVPAPTITTHDNPAIMQSGSSASWGIEPEDEATP